MSKACIAAPLMYTIIQSLRARPEESLDLADLDGVGKGLWSEDWGAGGIVQQMHAWGLGESRLGLSFLCEGTLTRGQVQGRLQAWILLKLLQLLLASFLHVSGRKEGRKEGRKRQTNKGGRVHIEKMSEYLLSQMTDAGSEASSSTHKVAEASVMLVLQKTSPNPSSISPYFKILSSFTLPSSS
ncbi:MAG: hypothetical protein FRX49_02486 [Trebouxia sp. A1-2]|nr:MAG: hypothetical protein FRX49_02486 [Trebouxia sp. A1-2]